MRNGRGAEAPRPRVLGDRRRNRELSEAVLEPLELGGVSVELGGAGAALPQDLAHQHEASDVQQQVVDLPGVHAASSAGTSSPSTFSTSGAGGFDSTRMAASTAPTAAMAASA